MRKQWHATEKINNFYIGPPPPHAPDLPELVQINNNYNWPVSYSNSILFGIGIAESVWVSCRSRRQRYRPPSKTPLVGAPIKNPPFERNCEFILGAFAGLSCKLKREMEALAVRQVITTWSSSTNDMKPTGSTSTNGLQSDLSRAFNWSERATITVRFRNQSICSHTYKLVIHESNKAVEEQCI